MAMDGYLDSFFLVLFHLKHYIWYLTFVQGQYTITLRRELLEPNLEDVSICQGTSNLYRRIGTKFGRRRIPPGKALCLIWVVS